MLLLFSIYSKHTVLCKLYTCVNDIAKMFLIICWISSSPDPDNAIAKK